MSAMENTLALLLAISLGLNLVAYFVIRSLHQDATDYKDKANHWHAEYLQYKEWFQELNREKHSKQRGWNQ